MTTATTNGVKARGIRDAGDALKATFVKSAAASSITQTNSRCICKYIDHGMWHVRYVVRNDFGPVRMPYNMLKVDIVPDVVDGQMRNETSSDLLPVNPLCNHS